jgi:LysR family glycine cleavage system transcriptional activator
MLNQKRLIPSTSMLMAFDASARNGSFTAAAHELHLTQGAVSRQVSALEEQLNTSLFKRIKKSIQLTEAGKSYQQEISRALKVIRDASLKAMSTPHGGIINLAILPTFGMRWLLPLFPEFLRKNPQVTVNFTSKLSVFDFDTENLHGAIHFGKDDWEDADCTFLMKEEVLPVASPRLFSNNKSISIEDIRTMPLIHLETRPNAWDQWFEQNGEGFKVSKGMIFEQFAVVTQAAVASLGAALLPRFMIESELARGELKVLIDIPLKSDDGYYFVTPKNYTSYAPIVSLREWLLDNAKH